MSRGSHIRNKGRVTKGWFPKPSVTSYSKRKALASKSRSGKQGAFRKAFGRFFDSTNPKLGRVRPSQRGSARSGVRRRLGKRRGSVVKYPGWFRNITKLVAPTRVVGEYYGSLSATANTKNSYVHWKNLSLIDIQNVITAGGAFTSATAPNLGTEKLYLTNLVRNHSWTNNSSNAQTHMQFYQLTPRRDIPATSVSAISPTSVNTASTGGIRAAPLMFNQAFTDEAKYTSGMGTAATQIANNDVQVTPYMASALCSMFKISPLRVKFPHGMSSAGVLLPGERIIYESKFKGPLLCNWNKYGLDGSAASTLAGTWEVLRETPLIFVQVRGVTAHDSTTNSSITYGLGDADYLQKFSYEIWRPTVAVAQTMHVTTGEATFAVGPEEANVMTGVEAPELNN